VSERRTLHIVDPSEAAFGGGKAPEPFVSAEEAAHFLSLKRRQLLALARRGLAGAYPLGTGTVRKVWVFRLSELAASVVQSGGPQNIGTVKSSTAGIPRR
jgi:hypothetical protein